MEMIFLPRAVCIYYIIYSYTVYILSTPIKIPVAKDLLIHMEYNLINRFKLPLSATLLEIYISFAKFTNSICITH